MLIHVKYFTPLLKNLVEYLMCIKQDIDFEMLLKTRCMLSERSGIKVLDRLKFFFDNIFTAIIHKKFDLEKKIKKF